MIQRLPKVFFQTIRSKCLPALHGETILHGDESEGPIRLFSFYLVNTEKVAMVVTGAGIKAAGNTINSICGSDALQVDNRYNQMDEKQDDGLDNDIQQHEDHRIF